MQETHEIQVPSLGQEDASGVGNGNLLQYSCQENPMDRGAWSVVHGITKSWTLMSYWAHICVSRDNLQTVAHLTCVTCNGFSLVSKWNWRWKACQYFKEILLSLSNMFWRSLPWKGLFWMGQSVQWLSDVWLFATPWTSAHQASCPSPTPGCYANSCPLSRWYHPAISSSAVPFSSRLESSLASGSFPISWFFSSGGQSIGVSASASVLRMNIQDWLPLGLTIWISLQILP